MVQAAAGVDRCQDAEAQAERDQEIIVATARMALFSSRPEMRGHMGAPRPLASVCADDSPRSALDHPREPAPIALRCRPVELQPLAHGLQRLRGCATAQDRGCDIAWDDLGSDEDQDRDDPERQDAPPPIRRKR